jgi:hypothetical protein
MKTISKLALIATIMAAGVASPAFAQSFSEDFGTGNVLPFSTEATVPQHQAVIPQGGPALRSGKLYNYVPATRGTVAAPRTIQPFGNPDSPALTGGASRGYNENLNIY